MTKATTLTGCGDVIKIFNCRLSLLLIGGSEVLEIQKLEIIASVYDASRTTVDRVILLKIDIGCIFCGFCLYTHIKS